MTSGSNRSNLSATLKKLSEHLDMLAGQVFSVEEALGTLISKADKDQRLSITKLQSLDFTRQSLEDCALMVELLSSDPSTLKPLADNLRIRDKLKLHATKGLMSAEDQETSLPKSGDLDLF